MTDEILSELLARAVEGVPVADPPVDALVRRGRAARRSRRRTTVLGAALACLLVIGGVGVVRWAAGPEDAPPIADTAGPPQPPSGMKWVGVGRKVVAVPAAWPVIPGIYCGEPTSPYVSITQWHVTVGCEPVPPHQVASVTVSGTASGRFTVDGPAARRTTLPSGWLAVPSGESLIGGAGSPSLTAEIEVLEAAGFRVERRHAAPTLRWQQVTTEPEIGTPARIGSTVVVYDRGATPSSATLTGGLSWVGGPAPGAPRPHAGIVHVTNADDSVDQTIRTDAAGRWKMYLPPGTYAVHATSPGYLSAAGASDACSADGQTTVATDQVVTVDVYCQLD